MTVGWGGVRFAAAGVEDDRWAERGEFDPQQDGWKMTAGWGGVRLAAAGVEDDCGAERGAFDPPAGWVEDD